MVRNKDNHFPGPREIKNPKAKADHAPKRANGQINTTPQKRMASDAELE